jgi:hypothetical protein
MVRRRREDDDDITAEHMGAPLQTTTPRRAAEADPWPPDALLTTTR